MEIIEFQQAAIAILKSEAGWQSNIARRLGVQPRAVRRWVAAKEAPAWARDRLKEILSSTNTAWPRDEWAIGRAIGGSRDYLYHMAPPRFTARVVNVNDTAEAPVDLTTGLVLYNGTIALCEAVFIDQVDHVSAQAWLQSGLDILKEAR